MEGSWQNHVILWRNPAAMNYYRLVFIPIVLFTLACQSPQTEEQLVFESLSRFPSTSLGESSTYFLGNEQILISGNKSGSFLDEGGIALASLNLLSGYTVSIKSEKNSFCLNEAESFTKYPFATSHNFKNAEMGIEVKKLEFITKNKSGVTLLYSIKNVDKSPKNLQFNFQPYTDLKPSALMDSTFGVNTPDQINHDELTGLFTAKDLENDWFAVWGSAAGYQLSSQNSDCTLALDSLGASAGFELSLALEAGEEKVIPVFIAGSDRSEISAMETLADLRLDLFSDWDKSYSLIDSLRKTSKLTIDDEEILQAYEWSKYKTGLFLVGKDKVSGLAKGADWEYQMLRNFSKDYLEKIDQEIFLRQNDYVQVDFQIVQPLVYSLLGISSNIVERVTYIRPNLPQDWKEASMENLWIDDNKLTIHITSDESQITVEVTQTQKKAGLSIELPEEYSRVKVLGKEVSNDTKYGYRRILMTGDHVKIEARR